LSKMAGSRSRNEKQGLMDAVRRRAVRGVGSVFQRANGVWVAELELGADRMTGRRVRRTFYGKTQREALEKRSAFVRDHEDGLVSAKPGRAQFHTLGEWLDYWLEGKVRDECEPTTYMLYDVAIRLHIKPGLGAVALRELEVDQVEAWLRSMKARGVGLRMRQVALARLRTALNFGLQRRQQTGLRYNAAALASMPTGKKTKVPPPNLDDARALLAAARGDRLEAVVTVGLALGLRRGEVLGLKWEDVDLDARMVRVHRRVSRVPGALLVREGRKMDPDASDAAAIPDMLVDALRAHRGRQLEERLRAGPRWKGPEPTVDGKPAGFVFTSMVGTVLEPRNVYRSFETMRHTAGLDDKTFHQLRHDCASLLLAQGVSMYAVSQIMRHSSPAITARFYAHLTPELQREAAQAIDDVLSPLMGG
jgi:integrase